MRVRQGGTVLIETASYSDIGGRPCNEDTVAIRTLGPDKALVVVADGLGGHGHGGQASQAAARVISGGWKGMSTPGTLTALVQDAHREILSMQTPACKMKSTVAVLAAEGTRIDWAYAGDTRLYHFQNGALIFQTQDHSASQIAVALGQITREQIRFHADRSRIFRALGIDGGLTVDTGEKMLPPGKHAFLLCSDGFWEYVYEAEMEKTLAAAATPQAWLDAMRGILAGRVPAGNDNNTAAALWLTV